MFGANYLGQPYFGQVNAGGGIIDQFPLPDIFKATTRFLNGLRNTLAISLLPRTTKRI